VLVLALVLAACNGILGIEDRPLRDAGASAVGDAAPTSADGGASPAEGGAAPHPYRDAVLADGPKVYYRFGEASGLTAKDETGSSNATYPNAGLTLGTKGALASESDTALTLDGATSIPFLGARVGSGTSSFTVEVWLKPANGDTAFLVDQEDYDPRHGWDLAIDSAGIYFERWNGAPHESAAAPPVTANTWHHLVGTWDGFDRRIFVDGALAASGAGSLALPTLTPGWSVGGQNCDCHANLFAGALDELAIYDKALTDAEIKHHYAVGTTP
jgi:hypothetical protein